MARDKDNAVSTDRRAFLRAMGAGAGLAVTAAAPLATEAAAATESPSEQKKARYNPNSEDVKTYYRVNGY